MGLYHEYMVVGRRKPSEAQPNPTLYRMRLFAPNQVVAKSRFWFFLSQLKRVKKSAGEVVSVNEIHERSPTKIKNYGIFLRYTSRSGVHNLYKEFRDVSRTGAVEQLYTDMAGRHRARHTTIQIIRVDEVPAGKCRRESVRQFHDRKIKFPLPHRLTVGPRKYRAKFKASRPRTYFG